MTLHIGFSGDRSDGLIIHLLKNLQQFVVIYTVKGFIIVNEAEVDVYSGISLLSP